MTHVQGHSNADYLRLIAEMVARYKQRTYELMHLAPGHRVLDVGCGPGTDSVALAQIVGSTGRVVGIDARQSSITIADQKAREAGVGAWVMHHHADATTLTFESNYFDSSRSERVFQHLVNPQQVLAEMVRVTKPGGWVVILDTDWSTMSIETDEIDIEQRLKRFHVEHGFANGYAGRQSYRLFRQQQFTDIQLEMAPTYVTDYRIARQGGLLDETEPAAVSAGIITQSELDSWHQSLEQAASEGRFFSSIHQVMIAGRKA